MSNSLEEILVAIFSASSIIFYHLVLIYYVKYFPEKTVLGLTRNSRKDFVKSIIQNDDAILGVQTLRNWITGSSLLATASVALIVSLVAVLTSLANASSNNNNNNTSSFGIKISQNYQIIIVICLLMISFFWFTQAIRMYNHVSILLTISADQSLKTEVDQNEEHGSQPLEFQDELPKNPTLKERIHDPISENPNHHNGGLELNGDSDDQDRQGTTNGHQAVRLSVLDQTDDERPSCSIDEASGTDSKIDYHDPMRMDDKSLRKKGRSASLITKTKKKLKNKKKRLREITMDIDFCAALLNRGTSYNSIGMRSFYVIFPVIFWIFGVYFFLGSTLLLVSMLAYLDFAIAQFNNHSHRYSKLSISEGGQV